MRTISEYTEEDANDFRRAVGHCVADASCEF